MNDNLDVSPGSSRAGNFDEPVIFYKSVSGRKGSSLPETGVPKANPGDIFDSEMIRTDDALLPELSEPDVVRHFTRLSTWNFGIDHGFYPLGSCTMKYNPKINEEVARFKGFTALHPYTAVKNAQGAIKLMVEFENMLAEISGMSAITLQPAAGAHGELTALMAIRAALTKRGDPRKKVLIPDTAHGTNPASSALNGYVVEQIASTKEGLLSVESLREKMDENVAALMLTNPNTLGLFEKDIVEICKIVHEKGGFVFGDGANLNAIMGKARPGDFGIDAMQFNLHKTFSTPHGGGGPGSGPVGVCAELEPFLPGPRPYKKKDNTYSYRITGDSIGRVRSFYGNFGVIVKAYTYILEMGADGLKEASEMAVLNANYLLNLIKDHYYIPYGNGRCMHEVVASDKNLLDETGISTLDVAKGLIDRGFHPPTIYFPLIVKGALMCEPTETESKETIEEFADAMIEIAKLAKTDPESLHNLPLTTRVSKLDEAAAARKPILKA